MVGRIIVTWNANYTGRGVSDNSSNLRIPSSNSNTYDWGVFGTSLGVYDLGTGVRASSYGGGALNTYYGIGGGSQYGNTQIRINDIDFYHSQNGGATDLGEVQAINIDLHDQGAANASLEC